MHSSQVRKQIFFLSALFTFSFVFTTSIVWVWEPGHGDIQNYADAVWWWFVTSSTVGYGDLVPVTTPGRIAGVLAIVIGIFGYTHIISVILNYLQAKFEEEERGLGEVDYKNHIVICEYTAFADELIKEIQKHPDFVERKLVIAGALVERAPYSQYDFIYGVPISPQVLLRTNISEASDVFVFANIRFSDPDLKTLHVVSRIMEHNTTGTVYVELNNEEHPMLETLPRKAVIMKSNDLLKNALKHHNFDLERYWDSKLSS
ncbi:ion channel [Gracilimonas sp.]|uniref:ion channel n=1 Tax=Gracilimonas sp. TaxID=1974203 RepID=UPI002870B73C|nr:ion channel [Gracilimonas sp.]